MNFELTKREKEVYELLATTSLTTKDIAKMLCVAESTIVRHKDNIYSKLMFHTRADLTRHYYEGILRKNDNRKEFYSVSARIKENA